MACNVEKIEPNAWLVTCGQLSRIVRYRADDRTFAPWDVTTLDGRRVWAAFSLESACRWVGSPHSEAAALLRAS